MLKDWRSVFDAFKNGTCGADNASDWRGIASSSAYRKDAYSAAMQ